MTEGPSICVHTPGTAPAEVGSLTRDLGGGSAGQVPWGTQTGIPGFPASRSLLSKPRQRYW